MKRVAIIGAGISGLFIANLFKRNPNYHLQLWEPITKHIIETMGSLDRPIIFMLWGDNVKKIKSLITSKTAIILEDVDPQDEKFSNCNHFIKTNEIFQKP